jgi:hypothetical protein
MDNFTVQIDENQSIISPLCNSKILIRHLFVNSTYNTINIKPLIRIRLELYGRLLQHHFHRKATMATERKMVKISPTYPNTIADMCTRKTTQKLHFFMFPRKVKTMASEPDAVVQFLLSLTQPETKFRQKCCLAAVDTFPMIRPSSSHWHSNDAFS